jgi:adenine-specific DNA-methyltransferase
MIENSEVLFPESGKGRPRQKKFLKDLKSQTMGFSTWLNSDFSNTDGTRILLEIFKEKIFDFPKPVELVQLLIAQITTSDDIVLDSFTGSGTTAHAVLAQNKEDGGNRRFILVECEDYADKITAERVRRVIKGVKGAKDEALREGLGGTFSYFELGKPIEMESILSGKNLPSYEELARYVFYTATGEEFNEKKIDEKRFFVGESKQFEVFLFYKPDLDFLKSTALTLDRAKALGKYKGKTRLVFAPTKYMDQEMLDEYRIAFAQLPFEIYKLAE